MRVRIVHHTMLLSLDLNHVLRVAGDDVQGAVLLNFQELQNSTLQEVRVRLKGSVSTYTLSLLDPH